MKYMVIEDHYSDNLAPLIIKKGAKVKVGRRSDDGESWPNWIYCCSMDGTTEGWAPVQIIEIEGEYGTVLKDYSARELDVRKGEIVDGSEELNGWLWCRKVEEPEEGWLPREKMIVNA